MDPAFLTEVDAAFADAWVLVGTDHALPEPERWFVYEAYATSLVVCRGPGEGDEALGAFVNACTHRGTRLCQGSGQGRIQCPYHGWVFGTDGRLLGATKRAGLPPFDDADLGLARRGVAQLNHLLFVPGRADPPQDLAAFLGEERERLAALELDRAPTLTKTIVDLPWEEALAVLPGRTVGPNLLVEDIPPLRLTTVVPLGPERSEQREYDWS